MGLLTGFNTKIAENPALSDSTKAQLSAATEEGIEIVTTEQVHAAILDAGGTPAEADAITADYGDAQLEALKKASSRWPSSPCSRSSSHGGYRTSR